MRMAESENPTERSNPALATTSNSSRAILQFLGLSPHNHSAS